MRPAANAAAGGVAAVVPAPVRARCSRRKTPRQHPPRRPSKRGPLRHRLRPRAGRGNPVAAQRSRSGRPATRSATRPATQRVRQARPNRAGAVGADRGRPMAGSGVRRRPAGKPARSPVRMVRQPKEPDTSRVARRIRARGCSAPPAPIPTSMPRSIWAPTTAGCLWPVHRPIPSGSSMRSPALSGSARGCSIPAGCRKRPWTVRWKRSPPAATSSSPTA